MGRKIELDESNFTREVLDAAGVVLVDFYAQWCPPCAKVMPIINEIADLLDGTVKVCSLNVETAGKLASRYDVMSIPTFIVFRRGEIVAREVGALSKEKLLALIEKGRI
jgi:thioredoxin 1